MKWLSYSMMNLHASLMKLGYNLMEQQLLPRLQLQRVLRQVRVLARVLVRLLRQQARVRLPALQHLPAQVLVQVLRVLQRAVQLPAVLVVVPLQLLLLRLLPVLRVHLHRAVLLPPALQHLQRPVHPVLPAQQQLVC